MKLTSFFAFALIFGFVLIFAVAPVSASQPLPTSRPTSLLATSTAMPATPLDSWEKSISLWKKIRDERQIMVSAKNESGQTHSNGVGLVNAEVSAVWNFANDPENFKKPAASLKVSVGIR